MLTIDRDYNAAVAFIDRHVIEGRGNKAAFVDPAREISYAELSSAVARVGPMLMRLGLERENRVILILHDTVDFPILFWGAIRAGIVPVLINTLLTSDHYHYLLEDTRAKVAFVSPSVVPSVLSAAKGVATLKHIVVVGEHSDRLQRFDALLAAQREPAPAAKTCADEVAYWLYSSGTTGMPKGVMHVHSTVNFISQLPGQSRLGFREDDRVFSTAKLFFAYGIGTSICVTRRRCDLDTLSRLADSCGSVQGASSLSADHDVRGADAVRGNARKRRVGSGSQFQAPAIVFFSWRAFTAAHRPWLEGALRARHL